MDWRGQDRNGLVFVGVIPFFRGRGRIGMDRIGMDRIGMVWFFNIKEKNNEESKNKN